MAKATVRQRQAKQASQQQSETVQGVVGRRMFYNPENGYCVLSLRARDAGPEDEDIKLSGNMVSVREGDEYKFTGRWTKHPKYGPQFKFSEAELILPTGKAGVARYFSGITYGVGLVKAQKIIDALGEDALDKIKKDHRVLEGLNFLTEQQRADIAEDLTTNSVQAELAGLICREGIGRGTVARIYNQYGNDAVRVVKENPYILADELWGVGFKKADAVAQSVGIAADSPYRVEAAINYTLNEAGSEGHVFLKPSTIVAKLIEKGGLIEASGVGVPEIAQANAKLISEQRCVREGDAIYSPKLYHAEKAVAAAVRKLLGAEAPKAEGLGGMVDETEEAFQVSYAPQQREGIMTALSSNFSILTGGPGVGKTTVTRAICEIYHRVHPRRQLYLAAPTGRAAKRMAEATGIEAKTIHRLLRYNPGINSFEYGYGNPLPGPGLLIVDESSMMDIELAASLLAAADELQVVLVGDIDQLPSVGPGSVLRDCIASGLVPTVRLEFNYRQAGGSKIAELANLVCRGEVPPLMTVGDFEFIPVEDAEQAAETVQTLVRSIMAEGYCQMDWQVLAPMHRGSCGVKALNEAVRELVNPAAEDKPSLGQYRLGDKVMVIKNDYNLGVFNGDLGEVAGINKGTMTIDFGDFRQDFALENLEILTLAYASTIHKSQGSEFSVVIMPLVRQHYIMLQRNLLYTGMTRAKRRLVLVADEWSVRRAVSNNVIGERFSLLAERIKDGLF